MKETKIQLGQGNIFNKWIFLALQFGLKRKYYVIQNCFIWFNCPFIDIVHANHKLMLTFHEINET